MNLDIETLKNMLEVFAIPAGTILTAWVALNSLVGRIDERLKLLQAGFLIIQEMLPKLTGDVSRLDLRLDHALDRLATVDVREMREREALEGRVRELELRVIRKGQENAA